MDFDIKEIHFNWLSDADDALLYFHLIDHARNMATNNAQNVKLGKFLGR